MANIQSTGPLYASSASQSGSGLSWSNPGNATGIDDNNLASVTGEGPGGGAPNQLILTGYGFQLPSYAVIDGIKLEAKVQTKDGINATDNFGTNQGVCLNYNGGSTLVANTPDIGQVWPLNGPAWVTWGSDSDLWGRSWTASDINNANFGAQLAAFSPASIADIYVDAARITVYWHVPPTFVPKRYEYKVYTQAGIFLGDLPNVRTDFAVSQDINTAGSQISVECAISADTAYLSVSVLQDETGAQLSDEAGNLLTDEGTLPVVGLGDSSALIRNGNRVVVWEYGYWNPNGKIVFQGMIQRHESLYGDTTQDEIISILIYSDGADLSNYMITSGPALDQSQTSQNSSFFLSDGSPPQIGQTVTPSSNVSGISRLTLHMAAVSTPNQLVSVWLYAGSNSVSNLSRALSAGVPDATASQIIGSTTAADYDFTFRYNFPANRGAGWSFAFVVVCEDNNEVYVFYQNSNTYSLGALFDESNDSGDLYFKTYAPTTSTSPLYTAEDPANILLGIFGDYKGRISCDVNTIAATGLSVTLQFNTNTVYEGIQAIQGVYPDGYYYYVDLGSNTLYFKPISSSPDLILTKGKEIGNLNLVATIEQSINTVLFSGGSVSGTNIYTLDSDATSIALYGPLLDRPVNAAVQDATTAHAFGSSEVAELKDEQFQTQVTILDYTTDLTLIKPGMVIGFQGFGNFIDFLQMQIIHIDYAPERVSLTLGILPKRLHMAVEQLTRGYIGLSTVDNPPTPS